MRIDWAEKIRAELSTMPKIKLYQAKSAVRKTPTIAFEVEDISPVEVYPNLRNS